MSDRLTMKGIAAEVLAVTDGQIRLDAAAEEETGKRTARPLVLSVTVAGRKILQVSTKEMHLRFGTGFHTGGQP